MSILDEARPLELVRTRDDSGYMSPWRVIAFPRILAVDEEFRIMCLGASTQPVWVDEVGRIHVDVENGHHVYVRIDTRVIEGRPVSYWRLGY